MRILYITAGVLVLALLLVSGCINDSVSETAGTLDAESAGHALNDTGAEVTPIEEPDAMLPDGANILVGDIVIENELYHSGELMRFNVSVSSDIYLEGVSVSAAGISGKMNMEKTVNISEGDNLIAFEFGLPGCNVCGGIKAGTHTIVTSVYYSGELVAGNSTSVEIRQ